MSYLTKTEISADGTLSLKALMPHKDTSSVCYYHCSLNDDGTFSLALYDADLVAINVAELPGAKKLRCTKNLIKMVSATTNRCWQIAKNGEHALADEDIRAAIDQKYRDLLSQLDTDIIEAILLCHFKGKLRRASITIEALNSELARRALLDDSSK